jgi:hypothetical protein
MLRREILMGAGVPVILVRRPAGKKETERPGVTISRRHPN